MVKLVQSKLAAVCDLYKEQDAFFPLIAAVLQGDQDGDVFCDRANSPRAFYAEHSFGFAQVFGYIDNNFKDALREHLVVKKTFRPNKVRLYTPEEPAFLRDTVYDRIRSERQRFASGGNVSHVAIPVDSVELRAVEVGDLPLLPTELVDMTRFWRTGGDFLASAHAVVAWCGAQVAAICYAAATASDRAEIDVATAANFSRRGLGKAVVAAFVESCRAAGVSPLWDCFTNNAGSMALARSCGFRPIGPAYSFYTISK